MESGKGEALEEGREAAATHDQELKAHARTTAGRQPGHKAQSQEASAPKGSLMNMRSAEGGQNAEEKEALDVEDAAVAACEAP